MITVTKVTPATQAASAMKDTMKAVAMTVGIAANKAKTTVKTIATSAAIGAKNATKSAVKAMTVGTTRTRVMTVKGTAATANSCELKKQLMQYEHGLAITRETFDHHFTKTAERVAFTFGGWDGKSYNGESRTAFVYRTNLQGFSGTRFIKVGKSLHYIEENTWILEKATGEKHKKASWLIDIARRAW